MWLEREYLRRDPRSGAGERAALESSLNRSRASQIDDPHVPFVVHYDVQALDVSVHDILAVKVSEATRGLYSEFEGECGGPLFLLLHASIERVQVLLGVFHEYEALLVLRRLVRADEGDEVTMTESRKEREFCGEVGRRELRSGPPRRIRQPQFHRALQSSKARHIDTAKSAPSKTLAGRDLVGRNAPVSDTRIGRPSLRYECQ